MGARTWKRRDKKEGISGCDLSSMIDGSKGQLESHNTFTGRAGAYDVIR
jgi:hypothetical protein